MASYNGVDMGLVMTMDTVYSPHERQINAFAGVNGLQVINHGARGAETFAEGVLAAGTTFNLLLAMGTFRAMQLSGGTALLIDTFGNPWTNVILVLFKPKGPRLNIQAGGQCIMYEMVFLHPSI